MLSLPLSYAERHAPPMKVSDAAVAEPLPPLNKLVAAADGDVRKTLLHRLWNWLQVVPPPLPLVTDLDRSHDGSLDLRQHLFSGRFMSAKLESAYAVYTLAVWRPRLRTFFGFNTVLEVVLLFRALLCRCGLRFDNYEGWALVYSFTFLMASNLVNWLILSPKLVRYTARMMPWLIPAVVLVDLIGFAIPLMLYLDYASPEAAVNNASLLTEDAAAMKLMQLSLVDQGAWFTSSIMTFTLFTSLASVTFGMGGFQVALLTPVAISCYLLFERKRFGHQYGIEPSLVPQSVIVYALCTILTFCHTGSTRQQFILRIYVQHERGLRVEQLEQEKERLDYERRFALRQSQEGAQQRDASSNSGSSAQQTGQRGGLPLNEGHGATALREILALNAGHISLAFSSSASSSEGCGVGISSAQQRSQRGGLALNEGHGAMALREILALNEGPVSLACSSSASSSVGASEPELGRGARASLSGPRVAASCSSRATQLMQGHGSAGDDPAPAG